MLIFDYSRGEEVCNSGLSEAVRVGIGIGVVLLVLLVLLAWGVYRRRRIQRANQVFITNPNTMPAQPYPPVYSQNGYDPNVYNQNNPYDYNQYGYNPHVPQQPPNAHAAYVR